MSHFLKPKIFGNEGRSARWLGHQSLDMQMIYHSSKFHWNPFSKKNVMAKNVTILGRKNVFLSWKNMFLWCQIKRREGITNTSRPHLTASPYGLTSRPHLTALPHGLPSRPPLMASSHGLTCFFPLKSIFLLSDELNFKNRRFWFPYIFDDLSHGVFDFFMGQPERWTPRHVLAFFDYIFENHEKGYQVFKKSSE